MIRFRVPAFAALLLLAAAGPAAAQAMDDAQRRAIESVVREYLIKNPEVIVEAIQSLQAREREESDQQARQALAANRQKLFENPDSPFIGNPKGDVTVVEFFDYQCGYCKAVHNDVQRLVKDDGKLRFVFKEFPILGPASLTASKAALAARGQGKYLEMHDALMTHRGQLDDDTVYRLARAAGLDVDRLKKDMESPDVLKVIATNQALAEQLGIRGTPGFIFGDTIVPGAIKLDEMKKLVATMRKG